MPVDAQSQTNSDELFQKVFGKSNTEDKRALIDASLGDFFIGEVSVNIVNEKITKISAGDLKRVLKDKIRPEQLEKYNLGDTDTSPENLPF